MLTAGCNHCREVSQGSEHTIHSARCDDVVPRVAQLHDCGSDGSHAYTPHMIPLALHAVHALDVIASFLLSHLSTGETVSGVLGGS